MKASRGWAAAYLVFTLFTVSMFSLLAYPVVDAALSFKSVDAGKKMQGAATGGYCTTSQRLYFTGFSKAATGGILDFSNVKIGASGYVMPRLGWCSDTAGVNVTVASITQQYMQYQATGAGTQRIWCPDRGEPYDVSGESSTSWDSANQVLTVTTGGASAVKVTWHGSGSGNIWDTVNMIMNLLPLLLVLSVVGALRVPDHRLFFIQVALIAGVLIFFANFMAALGL